MRRCLFALALLAGFHVGAANPEPAEPLEPGERDVEILKNLRYGDDPYLNALDVYRPRADGRYPVLVFIHGGGWSEGDKGNHPRKGTFFARKGYVYITLNYRLSPAVKHPAHADDVARALGWVHEKAADFGGDPSRIYLIGYSAGAHLAALVVADPRYLQRHGVPPGAIAGVALLDGSGYDLEKRVPNSRGWMRQMLVTAFGEDPANWRDASPIAHVPQNKRLPPFLIFHATGQKASIGQARELANAVAAAGGTAQLVAVPGRNHVTINRRLGLGDDPVAARILQFFSR